MVGRTTARQGLLRDSGTSGRNNECFLKRRKVRFTAVTAGRKTVKALEEPPCKMLGPVCIEKLSQRAVNEKPKADTSPAFQHDTKGKRRPRTKIVSAGQAEIGGG